MPTEAVSCSSRPVDLVGPLQRLHQRLRPAPCPRQVGVDQQRELVTADARRRARAERRADALRHLRQHGVAHRVAVGLVQGPEIVQPDVQHRQRRGAAVAGERGDVEREFELGPRHEPGERVASTQPVELGGRDLQARLQS